MADLRECPGCSVELPALVLVRNLSICPNCLRSLAFEGADVRFATSADTRALEPSELDNLRDLRKRPKRKRKA